MTKIPFSEFGTLALGILLSLVSAIICMQIMGQLGITPNTSLISAVLVMVVARVPLIAAQRFRNLERQNYVLSIASAAGFSAANCGFVAFAMLYVMGRTDLILPMAFGTLVGSMITVATAGRLFDTKIFPARGAWPLGSAVASSLEAGDSGGRKGFQLLQGLAVGALSGVFGIPAAGVGIAFIANMVTMAALAVGIVLRGYVPRFFGGFDIGDTYIAQGVMIGAGVVAFVQIFRTLSFKREGDSATISDLVGSAGLFVIGAIAIALVAGVFSEMGIAQAIFWVGFAGVSSVAVMILVGTASMHSGWAPSFAVVTICLTIGVFAGFPPLALVVLVGYIGSVGPCFADTGIGLKSGWLLRGQGADKERERYGRRQQILIKQLGVAIGIAVAVVFGMMLIRNDVLPPMSIFYADTIGANVDIAVIRQLVVWAVPGAVLQVVFGNKSAGLMLAAGLLINNAVFGLAILAALGVRLVVGEKHMGVRAPGLIAGDGLVGFVGNVFRVFF